MYAPSKLEETLALTVQQVETLIVKTFGAEGKVQTCNLVNLAIMSITWFFHFCQFQQYVSQ